MTRPSARPGGPPLALATLALLSCAASRDPAPAAAPTAPGPPSAPPPASGAFAAALTRLGDGSSEAAQAIGSGAAPSPEPRRIERGRPRILAAELRTTSVPGLVIEGEESLRAVVDAVVDATGLPLVVSVGAEAAAFDAGAVFDLNLTRPLAARHVLNLAAEQAGDDVVWVARHGAMLFVTAEKALAEKVVRLHDIRRLTFPRTDFVAPRIDRLRLLDELEDDDGASPFGGPAEGVSALTPDEVLKSVVEFVAPTTWEDAGVSIDVIEGGLVVVHTAAVQREVARYLRRLGDG